MAPRLRAPGLGPRSRRPRSSPPGRRRERAHARGPRPSRVRAGRRRRRGPSLERLRTAKAHAHPRKGEVTILTPELVAALLACRERTRVLVAIELLLLRALLWVEGFRLLRHHS